MLSGPTGETTPCPASAAAVLLGVLLHCRSCLVDSNITAIRSTEQAKPKPHASSSHGSCIQASASPGSSRCPGAHDGWHADGSRPAWCALSTTIPTSWWCSLWSSRYVYGSAWHEHWQSSLPPSSNSASNLRAHHWLGDTHGGGCPSAPPYSPAGRTLCNGTCLRFMYGCLLMQDMKCALVAWCMWPASWRL